MPTKQETFDTVVDHLRKQGAKAVANCGGGCSYRNPEGLKCAAGCLIPDDQYKPGFEGRWIEDTPLSDLAGFALELNALIETLGHDRILVKRLQQVHDGNRFEDYEELFERLAQRNGLTYTPIVPA